MYFLYQRQRYECFSAYNDDTSVVCLRVNHHCENSHSLSQVRAETVKQGCSKARKQYACLDNIVLLSSGSLDATAQQTHVVVSWQCLFCHAELIRNHGHWQMFSACMRLADQSDIDDGDQCRMHVNNIEAVSPFMCPLPTSHVCSALPYAIIAIGPQLSLMIPNASYDDHAYVKFELNSSAQLFIQSQSLRVDFFGADATSPLPTLVHICLTHCQL